MWSFIWDLFSSAFTWCCLLSVFKGILWNELCDFSGSLVMSTLPRVVVKAVRTVTFKMTRTSTSKSLTLRKVTNGKATLHCPKQGYPRQSSILYTVNFGFWTPLVKAGLRIPGDKLWIPKLRIPDSRRKTFPNETIFSFPVSKRKGWIYFLF